MDEQLIENWNSKVQPGDDVYHLGDFAFVKTANDMRRYTDRLNGNIIVIIGNHDNVWMLDEVFGYKNVHQMFEVREQNYPSIILCHYAMRAWNKSHRGSWHLFGHTHNQLGSYGKSFDCGVDAHNFFPLTIKEIADIMATLPDTPKEDQHHANVWEKKQSHTPGRIEYDDKGNNIGG